MADLVYYEVTGYSDMGLIVKFTMGHQTVFSTLIWNGAGPIDEFLSKQASFQGTRLKELALPRPDLSGYVGKKGHAEAFEPMPIVPPPPPPTAAD